MPLVMVFFARQGENPNNNQPQIDRTNVHLVAKFVERTRRILLSLSPPVTSGLQARQVSPVVRTLPMQTPHLTGVMCVRVSVLHYRLTVFAPVRC